MNEMLSREQLDEWLHGMASRLKPEAEHAAPGDLAELVAGEVEVIEPRVAVADLDHLHQMALEIIEVLQRIRRSHPDE